VNVVLGKNQKQRTRVKKHLESCCRTRYNKFYIRLTIGLLRLDQKDGPTRHSDEILTLYSKRTSLSNWLDFQLRSLTVVSRVTSLANLVKKKHRVIINLDSGKEATKTEIVMTGFIPVSRAITIPRSRSTVGDNSISHRRYESDDDDNNNNNNNNNNNSSSSHHRNHSMKIVKVVNDDIAATRATGKVLVATKNVFQRLRVVASPRRLLSDDDDDNNNNDNRNSAEDKIVNWKPTMLLSDRSSSNRSALVRKADTRICSPIKSRRGRSRDRLEVPKEEIVNNNLHCQNVCTTNENNNHLDQSLRRVEQIWDVAASSVHERCCATATSDGWCQNDLDEDEVRR
jgi:hypothetical protein